MGTAFFCGKNADQDMSSVGRAIFCAAIKKPTQPNTSKVFGRVGLLVNGPPDTVELPLIQSSDDLYSAPFWSRLPSV